MRKKIITYCILLVAVPALIFLGSLLFDSKQYAFVSLGIAAASCLPFFMSFERHEAGTQRMIVIAVMVALSVIGRILFTPVPGFKPVTAMVVVTAMYMGGEAGFLTGALTALISNFYFGQGPWTPVQMFVWGVVGLLAGVLAKPLVRSKIILAIYGVFAGIVYSLLMDVWTVLWWDGSFNIKRYIASVAASAGFTAIYAVSNVIFLLVLAKPIGKKLERVKMRYGM